MDAVELSRLALAPAGQWCCHCKGKRALEPESLQEGGGQLCHGAHGADTGTALLRRHLQLSSICSHSCSLRSALVSNQPVITAVTSPSRCLHSVVCRSQNYNYPLAFTVCLNSLLFFFFCRRAMARGSVTGPRAAWLRTRLLAGRGCLAHLGCPFLLPPHAKA